MSDQENKFGTFYFQKYLQKGTLAKYRGDSPALYRYWLRWFKKNIPLDSNVLEVGCGLGFFARRIHKYYSLVLSDIYF
jgi:2-polyprenyl-3-methyl-5-hydroxy-6-metoxy-1,4-benzoquinol methylase